MAGFMTRTPATVVRKNKMTSREQWARKVGRLEGDIAYEMSLLGYYVKEGNTAGAEVTRKGLVKLQAKLDKLNNE